MPNNDLSSDYFYQLIDMANSSIFWKDDDGYILGCNRYMLDLFGIQERNEVIGKSEYDYLIPEEASKIRKIDELVLKGIPYQGEESAEIDGVRKVFLVSKKQLIDSSGNVKGIIGTAIDVTIQKEKERLEKIIQEQEQEKHKEIIAQLERNLALIPSAFYWKDKNHRFLGVNEVSLQYVGLKSASEIIGKTDHDIWPPEYAERFIEDDIKVLETGQVISKEDEYTDVDGNVKYCHVIKAPLFDEENNIIGVIGNSIDITAKKEAERLALENKNQKIEHQEKLITLAHTVAHDISSPLSALNMMMHACDELKESKRTVIKRAIESILDIANNLLSTYRNDEQRATSDIEQRQPLLISDLIVQLLSEKKAQYSNHAVRFETEIANNAQFAFALLQASQFRRSISNLINNAVDALANKEHDIVTIKLTADAQFISVAVQDNGKGMPSSMIEKMLHRQSFTEGKQHGHGLGLQQVWNTLDTNQGTMNVNSTPDEGTTIQLTFPRIDAASWIAQTIHLELNSIVVILDDEESIHGAWDTRLALYLRLYPTLDVHHFKQGQDALDFFNKLNPEDKNRVVFLSDYELLRQKKNGLQIIEESGIKNTTLVTSYYANPQIRDKAIQLNVKILPKQMASIVPIEVELNRVLTHVQMSPR